MTSAFKIHSFYIVFILLAIIIGLISVEWANVPKLVDYITFALTLSSLILAILAIVYSIYSNTSITTSLSQISSASEDIVAASRDISSSNKKLRLEVEKLPHRLDSVDENIINSHKEIREMITKREPSISPTSQSPGLSNTTQLSAQTVYEFMKNSSLRGQEFLLMASLSYETKTSFSIEKIIEGIDGYDGAADYLLAYKVAANALGIIDYTIDGQNRDVYTFIHPEIVEKIYQIIKNEATEIAIEMSQEFEEVNQEDRIQEEMDNLNKIAAYFGKKVF